LLGFCSGIPLALTGSTLQAWMKTEGVDLSVIGLFSLVGMPYALKFFWAPLMDRFVPPFLGRRRGWILIMQAALAALVLAMAGLKPSKEPWLTALIAFLIAFSSASFDIVADAYRVEVLKPDELGPGASLYVLGYRLAMLFSGGLALILADHMAWRAVYVLMAVTIGLGALVTLFAPEPSSKIAAPEKLKDAIFLPFVEFFKRKGALEVLGFLLLYKIDVVMAVALTTPFVLDLGFTKTELGAVVKTLGLIATVAGTVVGGATMVRLKMERSLWAFGLAQGISNLTFMLLAHVGHNYAVMASAIGLENFCSGMGTAAYSAFIMSACDKRFSATQYALLSSIMALTRIVAASPTGFMVKAMGWEPFFLVCTLSMIPGLLILTRYKRWSLHAA
jgi:PAT family beta-lactamase induction signal transducer AmpG